MSENLPECERLAAELRTWRDRAGLTLTALAARSPYSRSSWQRYLSGALLPPWSAVQDLGTLTGAPEARLLALWELADAAWSGRDTVRAAVEASTTGPDPIMAPAPERTTERAADSAACSVAESPSEPASGEHDTVRTTADPEAVHRIETETATETAAKPNARRPRRAIPALAAWLSAAVAVAAVGLVIGYDKTRGPASIFACTGTACDGRDPQTAGCGVTPQTLLDESVPDGADLQIRYSPDCHAVWARIWNSQVGDVVTLSVPQGPRQTSPAADSASRVQFVYTPLDGMPGHGGTITACLASKTPGGAGCFTATAP